MDHEMTKLEEFIRRNRESFDTEEPRADHLERFMTLQQGRNLRQTGFSWKNLAAAAAILILLAVSSILLYQGTGLRKETDFITLADISQEYRDAEIYYMGLINRRYNEIKSFDFKTNPGEQELLLSELSEMDEIYRSLEADLNAEGANQRIVNAMLNHYQMKVTIMDMILEHLYQSQIAIQEEEENHFTIYPTGIYQGFEKG